MDYRKAAAIACSLISWVCRISGIVLCGITVVLCFGGIAARLGLVSYVIEFSRLLPDVIAGYGVLPTPFGGVFRMDFALSAFALFTIDFAAQKVSERIR